MSSRRNRTVLFITLALVISIALLFAFSPAARAAMETLLTFNGVTVRVDPGTGKLVVSGNMEAVTELSDTSVTIQGENGEVAGAGIGVAQAVESLEVGDLLALHPDLVLPSVPPAYSLQPQGEATGDSLTITWQDPRGHLIIYQRSPVQLLPEQAVPPETPPAGSVQSGSGFITMGGYSGPMLTYRWETGGYTHELILTDTSMSESDQLGMLP
ncbi:MAG: hypothetical protein C3F13_02655 [Anaerolineales bacterium]|nr:MAG: hypothetical protein C3F13_02655 [Anaerolineales bacterium]